MEKIIVFFFQNCERKSVFYYDFHNFLSQILWHEFTKSIYLKIISSIFHQTADNSCLDIFNGDRPWVEGRISHRLKSRPEVLQMMSGVLF